MLNGIASEMTKLRTGHTFLAFMIAGTTFVVVASWGILTSAHEAAAGTALDAVWATTEVIRGWFALSLVIAMFGAYFVARDFAQGTAARSIVMGGGRRAYVISKLASGAVIGVIGAGIGAALSLPSAWLLLLTESLSPSVDHTGWMVLLGCAVVNFAAGIWGVCLGLLVRNTIASLVTVFGLCLVVEPGVQAIAPAAGRLLMTNAMGSLYLDPRSGLLEVPQASIAVLGWLLVLGIGGYLVTLKKDLT
jgi:hypothetical protein